MAMLGDLEIGFAGLTIGEFEQIIKITTLVTGTVSMFGVGCRLRLSNFENNGKGLCLGLFLHVLIVPFMGFLISICMQLESTDALPTLIMSSAPVSSYASVLTLWANGDTGCSVLLAVLSSALSVGFLPLTYFLFSAYWNNNYFVVAGPINVVLYIVAIALPVGVGMELRHYFPKATALVLISKVCSGAFLLRSVGTLIFISVHYPEQFLVSWQAWIVVFLIPIAGFTIGLVSGHYLGLPYEITAAVSLALGALNTSMVVSVGKDSFEDPLLLQALLKVPVLHLIVTPLHGLVWVAIHRYIGREKYPLLYGKDTKLVDAVI